MHFVYPGAAICTNIKPIVSSSSPMGHKESLMLMMYGNCCMFELMQGVIHVKLYHRKHKEF